MKLWGSGVFSIFVPCYIMVIVIMTLEFWPFQVGNGPQSPWHPAPNKCAFVSPCRDPTEKAMAPYSSTLASKIPWMEEPGGLQSMGSLGVEHD